jgi:hypothetical protein
MFAIVHSNALDREEPRGSSRVQFHIWAELTAGIDHKVLADELGVSRGYYSKVARGEQGDLLELLFRLPPHRAPLRASFFVRLAEAEACDPIVSAWEDAERAVSRFLRLCAVKFQPAKANLVEQSERRRA